MASHDHQRTATSGRQLERQPRRFQLVSHTCFTSRPHSSAANLGAGVKVSKKQHEQTSTRLSVARVRKEKGRKRREQKRRVTSRIHGGHCRAQHDGCRSTSKGRSDQTGEDAMECLCLPSNPSDTTLCRRQRGLIEHQLKQECL